jgi:branched-chain amino acid transport system substrate-binding protein
MLFNHKNTKYKHHITNGDSEHEKERENVNRGDCRTVDVACGYEDIKVAVVGAMSGPVAQWGDMEFNGARQAIKDINAKGGIKATSWWAWNMTTPAIRNRPSRSPTKSSTTAFSTLSATCAPLPPSRRPISMKTKAF